jgi:hypothetical protein
MNMDKLFKALPRDLQWEVLSEFVGTHVVRNGKLIRKIAHTIGGGVVTGQRVRQRLSWLYDRHDNIQHYVRFYTNEQMKFCEDAITGDTIYCYRKIIDDLPLWEVQFTSPRAEDTITLPPFVKHTYPSYPYTNKKRRIPLTR